MAGKAPAAAPERPIQSHREDRLGREGFIRRLTGTLINESTGRSTGVVIGIAGPWGSGKSSLLNILNEHILATYPQALIVRFDPWLVSGREDLVGKFISEITGTINARPAPSRPDAPPPQRARIRPPARPRSPRRSRPAR